MVKISVIVPVYRVEQYLVQCIESIARQTHPNLEIILVDDGSPDGCGAICDAWQEKDARICVIHTENKGLSCARNTGIDHATGDYIMFVDSDDYIAPQMAARLLQQIERDQSDMAVCHHFTLHERSVPQQEKVVPGRAAFDAVLRKDQALRLFDARDTVYGSLAWNKLYAKKIFDHIRFPEGKTYEDIFSAHHIYGACTRISFLSDKLYYYRLREGSITTKLHSIYGLDLAEAYYQRAVFMKEHGYYGLAADAICYAQAALNDARHTIEKKEAQALIQSCDARCKKLFLACFWKILGRKSCYMAMLYIIHPQLFAMAKSAIRYILRCNIRLRTIGKSPEKETL